MYYVYFVMCISEEYKGDFLYINRFIFEIKILVLI